MNVTKHVLLHLFIFEEAFEKQMEMIGNEKNFLHLMCDSVCVCVRHTSSVLLITISFRPVQICVHEVIYSLLANEEHEEHQSGLAQTYN